MDLSDFQELFFQSLNGPLARILDLKTDAHTSLLMDGSPLQDSYRFRARFLGLRIAHVLLDEQGELKTSALFSLRELLKAQSFLIGPGREGDALLYGHIRNCIEFLSEDDRIWKSIRRFSMPVCHKKVEEVIRETLLPERIGHLETKHVRKAVLCAWFTMLRQATGSCFATAPAILVQAHYPHRFFKDLHDLIDMGQIKRTIAGKEYSVPFSLSPGIGDLPRTAPSLEHSLGINVSLKEVGISITAELRQKIQEMGPQSPEHVFKTLLMDEVGVSQDDIKDEEHLARIRMTPLMASQSAVYFQKPSHRQEKVNEWKKRFEKACTMFRTITDCSLLRSWEYSIASFADLKTEFTRWNLYIALGVHPNEKDGIGEFLYKRINGDLQKCHVDIEKMAREYEDSQGAMQALEVMFQNATNPMQRSQIKSELMTHNLSIESLMRARNALISKADALSGFFSSLLEQYDQKLQEYFQELFDPAMIVEQAEIIDDSAAGFRLVYKHGRRNASLWTPIYDADQYIDCLRDFFSNIENDLLVPDTLDRDYLTEITTGLVQFIQEKEFLDSSLARAKAKGRRSPWDYISGGTLQVLLASYLNRTQPFTEDVLIARSPEELLAFLKQVKKGRPLLMHSPTHAFIFYPDLLSDEDQEKFQPKKWDELMQEHIAHRLSERLPMEEKALFIHRFRQKTSPKNNQLARLNLIDSLSPRIKNKEAIVDAVLYEQTPLFTKAAAKDAIQQILRALGRSEALEDLVGDFFGAFDIYQLTKMVIIKSLKEALTEIDWDQKITDAMAALNFRPKTNLFADTNWSGWFFGFVTNPGTGHLELWRLNRNGTQGFPMSDWKQWLSEKNKDPWVILSNADEYSFDLNQF